MTIQYVNTGSGANAGDGDSLRTAFYKINNNFAELSSLNTDTSVIIVNSFPPTTSTEGTIWYDTVSGRNFIYYDGFWVDAAPPAVEPINLTTVTSHILPGANLTYDLGSTSSQWRSLYVGTSTIYLGGTALSVSDGNLTINGSAVFGPQGPQGPQGSQGTATNLSAVNENIIPNIDLAYDLGSLGNEFRVAWVGWLNLVNPGGPGGAEVIGTLATSNGTDWDPYSDGEIHINFWNGTNWVKLDNNGFTGTVTNFTVTNDAIIGGILNIDRGIHEKFTTSTSIITTTTYDCSSTQLFYHVTTDTVSNWTANFTNLSLESERATSVSIIINQGSTGYYPSAIQISGVEQTLNWQGNTTPTVSSNRNDVVTFSILNISGSYLVLGQLTGF